MPGERLEVGHDDVGPPRGDDAEPVPDRGRQLARRAGEVVPDRRPAADLPVVHREARAEDLVDARQPLAQEPERGAGRDDADVVARQQRAR